MMCDERGTIAVAFAVVLLALCGVIGLAVDHIRGVNLKAAIQTSLDAAVLAGAMADDGARDMAATRAFNENVGAESAPTVALSFSTLLQGRYHGQASSRMDTTFGGLLGFDTLDIAVTSTASFTHSGRLCILVKDTTASQALLVNNGADVEANDCEVHIGSTGGNAAVFNAGTAIESERLCIASNSILNNGGSHPNMETGCAVAGDPYAGSFLEPSSAVCEFTSLNFNGGNVTLNPGVYCGGVNFNAGTNVTLNPGVYVIKGGDWNVNGGDWMGTGVTFFFADTSRVQFNSAVRADLRAPTAGPYSGVAMFEKAGLARSPFVFNDSRGFDLEGIMYLPSRDVIWNGGSGVRAKRFAAVVNTLILDQVQWRLEPDDSLTGAAGGPARVALVE